MRVDELQRDLRSARDDQLAADAVAGRQRVDRYVRRARAQRTGVAVVIVLLLVSAGVFLATRGTDDQRVISTPTGIVHYLPEPLPTDGAMVQQYPLPSSSSPTSEAFGVSFETVVWTNETSDLPKDSSSVLIATVGTVEGSLDARAPQVSLDEERSTAYWSSGDGHTFSLYGAHVATAAFETARSSIAVGTDGRVRLTAPSGYREVVRNVTDSFAPSAPAIPEVLGALVPPDRPGYVVTFEDGSDRIQPTFSAAAAPRSDVWLLARTGGLSQTDVRGHPGYLVSLRGTSQSASSTGTTSTPQTVDLGTILLWWESDDLVLGALGATEADARSLAESLREVDDATWDAFVASAQSFPTGDQTDSQIFSSSGTAIATPTTVP